MAGRPRDPRANAAILAAALSILRERGLAALTVDEVARRARVGKSSLYGRFRDRGELVAAALASLQREPPPATGELRSDLVGYLRAVDRDMGSIGSEVLGALIGHHREDLLDGRGGLAGPLARRAHRLLASALSRGQIRRDADLGAAAALLIGSLLVRRLVGERGGQASWTERVVDTLLDGLAGRA
jgi:AcrR family transcriptional regulator